MAKSENSLYLFRSIILRFTTKIFFTHFTTEVCNSAILRLHVNILAEIYDSSDSNRKNCMSKLIIYYSPI